MVDRIYIIESNKYIKQGLLGGNIPRLQPLFLLLIVQYLKIYIINECTETHFLAVSMLADVFFYPLYIMEKFGIQKFPIATASTFYINIIFGVMNTVLLLIFNEIIELKFCGFEKDLNKNIEKRKNLEMDIFYNIYNDDENERISNMTISDSQVSRDPTIY